MSSASHAHADSAAHGAHDDHAFSGEPATALPPDEPRTPGWIPVLGIALFAGAAVIALAGSSDASASKEVAAKPEAAEPARVEAPVRPAQTAAPMPARRPGAAGTAEPAGSARRLSKEEAEALRKRIDEARAKGILPDLNKKK